MNPMTCNAESETGRVCEMQREHGGNMHAGGDPLKWWGRDGVMVDFGTPITPITEPSPWQ